MTTATEPTNAREMLRERTLASMEAKAATLYEQVYVARVVRENEATYQLTNPQGTIYTVDADAKTCTCPHWYFYRTCKHVRGIVALVARQDTELESARDKWDAAECVVNYWLDLMERLPEGERKERAECGLAAAGEKAEAAHREFLAIKERC